MFVYFIALLLTCSPILVAASPEDDRQQLQNHFLDKAPAIPIFSYADDHYRTIDKLASNGAPIYRDITRKGKKLFTARFANGNSYDFCFRSSGIGIASDYPYYDVLTGKVETIATEINQCREENGEAAYAYESAEIKAIQLYMASTSRKNITNIIMPNEPAAEKAFDAGKQIFFSRRGQLDMACAHCHIDYADKRYAGKSLPSALGLPLRMPRYDSKTDDVITLQQRINHCLSYTKAKPFTLQSETMRNLEFYLFYVNNGLPLNAPGVQ